MYLFQSAGKHMALPPLVINPEEAMCFVASLDPSRHPALSKF